MQRGKWAWPASTGKAGDWMVCRVASSNKIQSLGPKECESPGFFPPLVPREPLNLPYLPTSSDHPPERFSVHLPPLFPSSIPACFPLLAFLFSFVFQGGARSAV